MLGRAAPEAAVWSASPSLAVLARGPAPHRPSAVCCRDVLALPIFKQEEPQLSPETEARLPPLQYVLCAATSPAVKLHEETLTYLNQGGGRAPGGQPARAACPEGAVTRHRFGFLYLAAAGEVGVRKEAVVSD